MRNIYILLLFSVLYSATAFAQEAEYKKSNPYVLCMAHINNVELIAIAEGKRIKIDVGDRKVKGVIQRITSDSIFFKRGDGVAIALIDRVKVPLPGHKIFKIACAIPSVIWMASYPAHYMARGVSFGWSLILGSPYMGAPIALMIGSVNIATKWFEASYEWKLSGMTIKDLKSINEDQMKVRIFK